MTKTHLTAGAGSPADGADGAPGPTGARGWRLATLVVLAAALATCGAQHAAAFGAVAEGKDREGRTSYTSVNVVVGYETAEAARSAALDGCRSGNRGATMRCEIVATFQGKCYASARDGTDDKSSIDWALASSESEATSRATELCRSRRAFDQERCSLAGRVLCDRRAFATTPWVEGKAETAGGTAIDRWMPIVAIAIAGIVGLLWIIGKVTGRGASGRRSAPAGAAPMATAAPPGQPAMVQPGYAPSALPEPVSAAPTTVIPIVRFELKPIRGGMPLMLDSGLLTGPGVVIGRRSACDIVLDDPKISARHARLWVDAGGALMVEDLQSTNGTRRNGQRVSRATLRVGDTLRLGETEYRIG